MRIPKCIVGVVITGAALATAALCPACVVATGEAPRDSSAAPHADWTGIGPLMGRGDVEKVRGGFMFTEGAVWIASKGMLLFSDIPVGTIHQLQPPATFTVFRMPSGKSNGLGLDAQGRLIASEGDTDPPTGSRPTRHASSTSRACSGSIRRARFTTLPTPT